MRDNLNPFGSTSAYENLLALFPHIESEVKRIEMQARCHGQDVCYALEGKTQTILLDPEEQKMLFRFSTRRENLLPSECQAFQGELEVRTESGQEKKEISFHEYSTISGRGIASSRLLNVVYLAPFDHLRGGMLSSIIKNDSYKDLCVGILQLFDPGITDLLLLKNEITNRPIECVRHKELGTMPLSTYGDGIKKVLSIASGISKAPGTHIISIFSFFAPWRTSSSTAPDNNLELINSLNLATIMQNFSLFTVNIPSIIFGIISPW